MVECFLAKEDVASSSLVSRSIKNTHQKMGVFYLGDNGENEPFASSNSLLQLLVNKMNLEMEYLLGSRSIKEP